HVNLDVRMSRFEMRNRGRGEYETSHLGKLDEEHASRRRRRGVRNVVGHAANDGEQRAEWHTDPAIKSPHPGDGHEAADSTPVASSDSSQRSRRSSITTTQAT